MHISTIEIENFRNLKSCVLDLRAGLNVVVGRNGVGKSNAIRAIRHALGSAAASGDLPRLERSDFREVDGVPQTMKVTLRFTCLSRKDRTTFFEMLVPNLLAIEKSEARLVFEATWTSKSRAAPRRWAGPERADGSVVPHALLAALPITFLPALRDAEAALTPGYHNRLARLLDVLADEQDRTDVVAIFQTANDALEDQRLIKDTLKDVRGSAERMSGTDFRQPSIRTAEPEIARILRTLRLTIDGAPVEETGAAGLGYQNILYVATVLAHLTKQADGDCPLLIVEEPEAHLHPQLVVLLAESLANDKPGQQAPQTVVTTHSPTFAANVQPQQLIVMVADDAGHGTARALARAKLDEREARAVQRMMDVTRSALYFAKGVILVEGISESLLIPALAKQLQKDLKRAHVSIIPICGVAFGTLAKLLHDDVLGIPVAIISDGDPTTEYEKGSDKDWATATPGRTDGGALQVCDRLQSLRGTFASHPNVKVFASDVTLEYDLAAAAAANPPIIAAVWESLFDGTPRTLNKSRVAEAANHDEATLAVWRGICLACSAGSKADFAHRLAAELEDDDGIDTAGFEVPGYIKSAIDHVLGADTTSTVSDPEEGSK